MTRSPEFPRQIAQPAMAEEAPLHKPVFQTPQFCINFMTTDPAGFRVQTDQALPQLSGIPEHGALQLTPEQRSAVNNGMGREMRFMGVNALRTAHRAWRNARTSQDPNEPELAEVYHQAGISYLNRGRKIGLRNVRENDGTLVIDVKAIPFPFYSELAIPGASNEALEVSMAAAVATIVRTSDNRLIVQHRGVERQRITEAGKAPGNRAFADVPGASAGGMLDASSLTPNRKLGTPDPIDTESVHTMIRREVREELGLEQLDDLRIVGLASETVKPHHEFLLMGSTSLTSQQVEESSQASERNKRLHPFDLAEKLFSIPAATSAIEALLCDIKCPVPPTHAAAFVAAGYLMALEDHGADAAAAWCNDLEERMTRHYASIDDTVRNFYAEHPSVANKVPERYWGKPVPARNLNGYDASYAPSEQGLPSFEDEMVRTGLMPETRRHVSSAYLFDVDGVLTDPVEKRVTDDRVYTEIIDRLTSGKPVGLNTGRSIEWMMKNFVTPLIDRMDAQGLDRQYLANLIAIGEKGGAWMTFDEEGTQHMGVVDSISVPGTLQASVQELIKAKYPESMFFDTTKKTMISVEMRDGHDLSDFTARQGELVADLVGLLGTFPGGNDYQIDPTTIATDIESPHVGKALGTDRFLEFLRVRGIVPTRFEAYGDSASDLSMAEELVERGESVQFIYVGDPSKITADGVKYGVKIPSQPYTRGTVEALRSER